jgi:endonuclease IV
MEVELGDSSESGREANALCNLIWCHMHSAQSDLEQERCLRFISYVETELGSSSES